MKYAVNGTTVAANGTVYHKGDKWRVAQLSHGTTIKWMPHPSRLLAKGGNPTDRTVGLYPRRDEPKRINRVVSHPFGSAQGRLLRKAQGWGIRFAFFRDSENMSDEAVPPAFVLESAEAGPPAG